MIFEGAMLATTDHELLDFFNDARTNMPYWFAVIKLYQGLVEHERYKLEYLSYQAISTGRTFQDLQITFNFGKITCS